MSTQNQDQGVSEAIPPFAEWRARMVDEQLRERGMRDERVLQAMRSVPREEFVEEYLRHRAYDDGPLPIGFGQTISQPFTVAFMCEALQLTGTERVLEVGTGSGYAAAVLSLLAQEVFTIERIPALAEQARKRLDRLGYRNVQVNTGDGTLGLPEHAPYAGIVVTAGAAMLPQPYVEQLAVGGRIVIPVGGYPFGQTMYRYTKRPQGLQVEDLGGFAFVPLIGHHGWNDRSLGEM
jgi:protein-L-isoaspartate(D-aspartate) O-methyltransferase